MPTLLVPSENRIELFRWAAAARGEVFLFSPFVGKDLICALESAFPVGGQVNLLVRARPKDFMEKATSVAALQEVCRRGWSIRRHPDLHAKIFWDSAGNFLLGSANLTSRGFSVPPKGNFEVVVRGERLPDTLLEELKVFWEESLMMDIAELEEIEEYIEKNLPRNAPDSFADFPQTPFQRKIRNRVLDKPFLLSDIPQSESLEAIIQALSRQPLVRSEVFDHDFNLLDLAPGMRRESVFARFNSLPLVQALLEYNGEGRMFGDLRRWLTSNVEDVPTPSRQEFNFQLNKLYRFVIEANPGKYDDHVPGTHSHMLRKLRD